MNDPESRESTFSEDLETAMGMVTLYPTFKSPTTIAKNLVHASHAHRCASEAAVTEIADHLRAMGYSAKVVVRGYFTGREVIEVSLAPEEPFKSCPNLPEDHKA